MYDELIKRLRNRRICIQQSGSLDDFPLLKEAADAIEELCGLCASLSKDCSEAVAKYLELWEKQPRWIPVTERLPEPYTWVLVSAEKHKVAFDAFYDGAQWKNAVLNGEIVTHWMPLPQRPEEG